LRHTPIETHLIITSSARLTIEQETGWKSAEVLALASAHYSHRDMAASIASGSFDTLGMVVIPCSVKSLSAIANSYSADLLARAADVTLKEGRPLVLVFREAPLHAGHIQLMEQAAHAGAILFPPVPAFYTHPQTVDEIVDNIVGRVLRRLGIENTLYTQWQGIETNSEVSSKTEPGIQPVLENEDNELWDLPAMTLATTDRHGMPCAAAVYFVVGQDHLLFFFSASDSQHSLNLSVNQRAAVTIHPLANSWQEIRGLQLQGQVRPVTTGQEWEMAWALYTSKFPFAADLKDVVAKNTLYAFQPEWIRLVDNRRGFGFKEEWTSKHDQQP
ncbi:MAG: UbiX family flavin prenyltransferase, partial [Anaerolineaceae bacterium]|nr:UbiX family flavin prenyltransferase [Anaerolineaceae bacterium]